MEQTVQREWKIRIIPATKPVSAPGQSSGRRQRVAAYCRVSTDSEEQLTSYTAQKAYYTPKIGENPDWEMAGIFADKGITGTNMKKRTEFKWSYFLLRPRLPSSPRFRSAIFPSEEERNRFSLSSKA